MSDCRKIAINGYVTIKNGNKIIVDRGKNAIVRQGMRHIVTCMTWVSIYMSCAYNPRTCTFYGASHTPQLQFGKSNAPTTQLMDTLVSNINVNANSIVNAGIVTRASSFEVFTQFVAWWNAGVLNAQLLEGEMLGEVGLFLGLFDSFSVGGTISVPKDGSINPAEILFSRFSLGDAAFVPDSSKPVSVEWEFGWEFV